MTCNSPAVLQLVLGAVTLDLMNPVNGFWIAQVDLGFPAVREAATNRPDADGTIDETRFVGPRVVTISGQAVATAAASRSAVLASLAPFLDPAARPVLVYAIDADQPARLLNLRGSDLTAPATHPSISSFQAAWKTPDPWSYSNTLHSVSVPPSSTTTGRTYPLVFPRHYPAGTTTSVTATNAGTRPTKPIFRVDGPASAITIYGGGVVAFLPSFGVDAGRHVTVDCTNHPAMLDDTYNVFGQIDFANTTWPVFAPGVNNTVQLDASATSTTTLLTCTWRDAWYL